MTSRKDDGQNVGAAKRRQGRTVHNRDEEKPECAQMAQRGRIACRTRFCGENEVRKCLKREQSFGQLTSEPGALKMARLAPGCV